MNSFSCTISSADNLGNNSATNNFIANNCVVVNTRISIESKNRLFKCCVKSFIINPASFTTGTTEGRFVNLVSSNFASGGSFITGNRNNQIIATCELNTGMNNNVNNTFDIENTNSRVITFILQDEFGFNLPYSRLNQNTFNTTWLLTLELTPIDDVVNDKYQLKHGL